MTTSAFQACHQDPLLDDSITFARHLHALGVRHHLLVVHNLTHGFLSFYNANNLCKRTTNQIMADLARQYQINGPFLTPLKKKKRSRKTHFLSFTNPISINLTGE